MTRAPALVLVFALAGCTFAQKHPGVTTGLVAGTIAFGMCGLAVEKLGDCAKVGAVAGVGIGGITGLVTTFFTTSATEMPQDEEDAPIRRIKSQGPPPGPYLPPDPNPLPQAALPDAGVPAPAPADAALPADASSAVLPAAP